MVLGFVVFLGLVFKGLGLGGWGCEYRYHNGGVYYIGIIIGIHFPTLP